MKDAKMRPAEAVTVSAETYRRLVNFALPGGTINGRANGDDTVTFSIPASVADALRLVDADPEKALSNILTTPLH